MPSPAPSFFAFGFGLRWQSDCPLPLLTPVPDDGSVADVVVRRRVALPPRDDGMPVNAGTLHDNGIRFALDGAAFEMIDGCRIDWVADADEPPLPFYSTVTAMLLAWRGAVPLHCSAVAIDGKAVLIGGRSGAGKSTLATALVEAGGALVSDDLSVLAPAGPGGVPHLWPGRPTVRLIDPDRTGGDGRDKLLVRPPMVDVTVPVPVTTLLLLRAAPVPAGIADRIDTLRQQLFRPTWMSRMPRRGEHLTTLLAAARHLSIVTLPPAADAAHQTPAERAAIMRALIR